MNKLVSSLLPTIVCATVGCSSGYKTDNGEVYWHGWNESVGKTEDLVPGADASTFVILDNRTYGKDTKGCYYKTERVVNADPVSFVSLSDHYAKDTRNAYCGHQLIPGSDGGSFQLIDGTWSKDKNKCFVGTEVVTGADPGSFRVIGGYLNSWAADDNSYFYNHQEVPTQDFASFNILEGGFSKDEKAVFFGANPVVGADPRSFQMVKGTYVGKDKKSYYRFGESFVPSQDWLQDMGLTN